MNVLAGQDSLLWWDWVVDHTDLIAERTLEHLRLTGLALLVGFALSSLLAAVALRFRVTLPPITWFAAIVYGIPSLALFAFLVPISGLSTVTALVALVGYTLLILIQNIVAGIDGVPTTVREAADAMGYRPLRRFFAVDLPLALPTIVAGLRIAAVTTIGLVTVAALVGQGGLGAMIENGLNRNNFKTPITVGGGLSILLAVAADVGLLGLEKALTPWRRQAAERI